MPAHQKLKQKQLRRFSPSRLGTGKKQIPLIHKNISGEFNQLQYGGAQLDSVTFNIFGNYNSIIIGDNTKLKDVSFNIYGDFHRIYLGQSVSFNGRSEIWAEDNHCLIQIGNDSSFEGVHLSATEPESVISIGEGCMFSYDIDVRTGDSHSLLDRAGNRLNYARNISFGRYVWVASHCVFTKGANIGDHSVVASRSLVNKTFRQTNVVLAGSPAQIVKKDIDWKRERVYQAHGTKITPFQESAKVG